MAESDARWPAALVRPGQAEGIPTPWFATTAPDATYALLATDELRRRVEHYLQTGAVGTLIDVRELAAVLAAEQGVDAGRLERLSDARRTALGTYQARCVLHAPVLPD